MSLVISKVFTYDTDAGNYIQAVEAADGQALEPATRQAINNFVIGCKQDGIWNAIKASCILSGARTLNGALQPLAGTAPTNNSFASGDYNRKTGLLGNRSNTLNTNYSRSSVPQNSRHLCCYLSSDTTLTNAYQAYIGNDYGSGFDYVGTLDNATSLIGSLASNSTLPTFANKRVASGFIGIRRNSQSTVTLRSRLSELAVTDSSVSLTASNFFVFGQDANTNRSNARVAFYSIGESLDLALLDTRVTALITAFGVAIP